MNEKLQRPGGSLATPLTTTTTTTTTSIPIIDTEEYCFETTFSEAAEAKAHEANASNELYLYTSVAATAIATATATGNLSNPNIPTTISGNLNASGSSGITNTYGMPTEVPTEFGGTLKSSKGSRNIAGVGGSGSGTNSNLHSPSRRVSGFDGEAANAGGCSACFGGAAGAGSKRSVLQDFWPTLLANFGICVLLLGYVMIGSFIFLTIENSGGDIAKAITAARDARTHGSDVDSHDPAASWHFTTAPRMPQKFAQQQSPSSSSSSSSTLASSSTTSAVAEQQKQQQKQHQTFEAIREAASIASNLKQQQHMSVQQPSTHTYSADNMTHIMSVQRTSASSTVILQEEVAAPAPAAAALTSTHVSSKSSTFATSETETNSNDNTLFLHNYKNNEDFTADETDSRPKAAAAAKAAALAATSNNANVDYELQTMNLRTNLDVAAQRQVREVTENEDMDVLLTVEDMERQRTVENIWDITVSLNILYKENWTRLAALEIAKFQDQLVRRLVMDMSASNTATSTSNGGLGATNMMTSNDAQTGTTHNNNEAGGDGSSNLGHGTLTISQHRKHFNGRRQEQQQQQNSFWLFQLQQQQQYHQRQQQLRQRQLQFEWNLASAFLYSLTVITTVGYGTITPRTTLGRMATIGYATLGIPLTLIYLASMGSLLARLTRAFCTRAICSYCCCCFCCVGNSKRQKQQQQQQCGYNRSSIISKQQQVYEQRKCELKLKQVKQTTQQQQQQQQQQHLPYCYVRPPATDVGGGGSIMSGVMGGGGMADISSYDSLSSSGVATSTAPAAVVAGNDAAAVQHCARVLQWSLAAPVAICALLLLIYVCVGAVVISLLEQWPLIDGVYFCFMSLTTIGFCDLLPGLGGGNESGSSTTSSAISTTQPTFSIWFCAFYILTGLTLTSMCVNLLHEEILLRMRVVVKFKKISSAKELKERSGFYGAPPP